jgi:hypothetical protein
MKGEEGRAVQDPRPMEAEKAFETLEVQESSKSRRRRIIAIAETHSSLSPICSCKAGRK